MAKIPEFLVSGQLARLISVVAAVAFCVGAVNVEGQTGGKSIKAGPYKDYKQWAKMNETPVFSATHGGSFVFTYVNPKGLPSAKVGNFPFPVGTVIVKEAFINDGCKPGGSGAVFVMEKRAMGYDPAANDWHWVRYNPDGTLWAEGKSGSQVQFCPACHLTAKINDYVFGNGTTIKATPTMPLTPCK